MGTENALSQIGSLHRNQKNIQAAVDLKVPSKAVIELECQKIIDTANKAVASLLDGMAIQSSHKKALTRSRKLLEKLAGDEFSDADLSEVGKGGNYSSFVKKDRPNKPSQENVATQKENVATLKEDLASESITGDSFREVGLEFPGKPLTKYLEKQATSNSPNSHLYTIENVKRVFDLALQMVKEGGELTNSRFSKRNELWK